MVNNYRKSERLSAGIVNPSGLLVRLPRPALRAFVKVVWASEAPRAASAGAARELVLPTGSAHVAVRLSDEPLCLFDGDGDGERPKPVGHVVVGGPRTGAYVRDISTPARSVGAQLRPGALSLLTRGSARELAGRHVTLEELWGGTASALRERMLELDDLEAALDLLETSLAERLPRVLSLHPAIAHALERFARAGDVALAVRESGYSHRRFDTLFADAVGLPPKAYCRVLRLTRAVELARQPAASLAEVALEAGYADQPHLCREFRALGGITPARYRKTAPALAHHVPLGSL